MAERHGARYRIDPATKRPANHHGEHTQRTNATAWADRVNRMSFSEAREAGMPFMDDPHISSTSKDY